jgi:hypothetical protein
MCEVDELNASVDREINYYDVCLAEIKEYVELVPSIMRRKQEAEAKKAFLENAPADVVDEFAQTVLQIQLDDEKQVFEFIPTLPRLSDKTKIFLESASSTGTVYQTVASGVVKYQEAQGDDITWVSPVIEIFTELAKSYETDLPGKLDQVNRDLGESFVVARESVEKARGGIIKIDQAIMHMRDVLNQLWAGLVSLARSKSRIPQGLEMRRESARLAVAKELATNEIHNEKLVLNLQSLAQLYRDCSETEIGKNPLGKDFSKMEELYSRWIMIIHTLTDLVIK